MSSSAMLHPNRSFSDGNVSGDTDSETSSFEQESGADGGVKSVSSSNKSSKDERNAIDHQQNDSHKASRGSRF